jgi:hypothetical protein
VKPLGSCIFVFAAGMLSCRAADLQEIVQRAGEAIKTDWAADLDYSWLERDEVHQNDKSTSKSYQVVMIAGSDYYMPVAANDQPLTPEQKKSEREKLRNEVQRRNSETPQARRQRLENFQKQREENDALVFELPRAFNFQLVREELKNGHPAYVLSAAPRKRSGPMSRAARVLTGMQGTIWIDKESFHTIRAEVDVITSVPIYGILARVMPGTHLDFEMAPVSDSVWLMTERSMTLAVSKLFFFKSTQETRSEFSGYRPNSAALDLLTKEE